MNLHFNFNTRWVIGHIEIVEIKFEWGVRGREWKGGRIGGRRGGGTSQNHQPFLRGIPPTLPDISPLVAEKPPAVRPLEYAEYLSTLPMMFIKRWTPWQGDSRARQIQGWLNTCPGGAVGGSVPASVWSPLPQESGRVLSNSEWVLSVTIHMMCQSVWQGMWGARDCGWELLERSCVCRD